MDTKIVTGKISKAELEEMASSSFLDFVKGVADLEREIIAFGGELHADEEQALLQNGSKQENLWGFNIFPAKSQEEAIEYTSLINIRPRAGNRGLEIESDEVRNKIKQIVWKLVDGTN